MPALVVFGRRWQIGSDDFVVPTFLDLLIRIAWLIAAVVIYWKNDTNLNLDCEGGFHIRSYLYGVFATLHLIIITDIVLVHNSKAGFMMDTEARKYVPLCIYIRSLLQVFEIGWNIVGTIWAFNEKLVCTAASEAETLIKALVISNWVLIAIMFIGIIIVFDPIGGYKYTIDPDNIVDRKLAKVWGKRCRIYFCCCSGRKSSLRSAFQEIGRLFAEGFEDVDMVPSDAIAGMILLFLRNEEMNRSALTEVSVTTLTPSANKSPSIVTTEPLQILWPATEKWNSMALLSHFLKYGIGTYGWPMLFIGRNKPFRLLWKESFCCGCIPGRNHPLDVEGDNCCFAHTAAMKEFIDLENSDIVFASFKNKIFQTPFFVAVDHPTKSIVIAIRGTLTPKDIVTDLLATPTSLDIPGLPESFKAHAGMLRSAKKVKEIMENHKLLAKLFASHPDYNLVLTGTSLGAGIATILSMMMRSEYPNLKCYAYCAPGALLSLDAAKYCEDFVVTVIYGDDIIPRLGMFSIESWKYQILAAITECKTPKYRVLIGGCYWLTGGFPKISYDEDPDTFRRDSRLQLIKSEEVQQDQDETEIEAEPAINMRIGAATSKLNDTIPSPMVRKPMPYEHMYPPGNILYVTETPAFTLGHKNPNYSGDPRWTVRWAVRSEFRELTISPRMLLDHLPFRMHKALKDFVVRNSSSIEINPTNLPVINSTVKT